MWWWSSHYYYCRSNINVNAHNGASDWISSGYCGETTDADANGFGSKHGDSETFTVMRPWRYCQFLYLSFALSSRAVAHYRYSTAVRLDDQYHR